MCVLESEKEEEGERKNNENIKYRMTGNSEILKIIVTDSARSTILVFFVNSSKTKMAKSLWLTCMNDPLN